MNPYPDLQCFQTKIVGFQSILFFISKHFHIQPLPNGEGICVLRFFVQPLLKLNFNVGGGGAYWAKIEKNTTDKSLIFNLIPF